MSKSMSSLGGVVGLTEEQYDAVIQALNILLDAGGGNETNELAPLVDILGDSILKYEDKHYPHKI